MRVVTPLDLRRSLGAILDAASAGERFVVERDHRPLAMLVSVEDGRRLEPDAGEASARRLAALDRLEALGARVVAHERAATRGVPAGAPGAGSTPAPAPAPAPAGGRVDTGPAPSRSRAAPAAQAGPSPAPVPERSPTADRDRHLAERRRHAGEDLVGLG